MEIVDAQVHFNLIGGVDIGLSAMDAAGVDAILMDEFNGFTPTGKRMPGVELPNGAVRSIYPVSEEVAAKHAGRFGYIARVDRRDPEMDRVMSEVRSKPERLCIRLTPQAKSGELDAFAQGAYMDLLASAERHNVPCFVLTPGRTDMLIPYVEKYPAQQFIIDHCGFLLHGATPQGPGRFDGLEPAIQMAKYPNVALKWCYAPALSEQGYPYADVMPHFLRVLDAFTPQRVVWASDYTHTREDYSWAESFFYIRDSNALSDGDKEWVLGRSLRTLLRWAKPERKAKTAAH